jgi:gluconolactonase
LESGPAGPTGTMICGLPGMQLFDSLGVDSDGNIVVATLVTGALTVVSPAGDVLDQVLLGDPMVTNVCWGGDDMRTAFATLSAVGRLVSFEWPRPGLKLNY